MKQPYRIISASSPFMTTAADRLEARVGAAIADGYVPTGGMAGAIADGIVTLAQAVTLAPRSPNDRALTPDEVQAIADRVYRLDTTDRGTPAPVEAARAAADAAARPVHCRDCNGGEVCPTCDDYGYGYRKP
jgi:hypothetical protein